MGCVVQLVTRIIFDIGVVYVKLNHFLLYNDCWGAYIMRRFFLLLSILSICNYAYSFYTVMADLSFISKFQNVFVILMCSAFSFLLFASKNKEILSLLKKYYLSLKMKPMGGDYTHVLLFCFIFISYAHYYISELLFKLIFDAVSKVVPIYLYSTVESYVYIYFSTNCMFFVLYSMPVIYSFMRLKSGAENVTHLRRDE